MERREFIGLSAFTAMAIALNACSGSGIDQNISNPAMLAEITGEKNIRETGRDYLKLFPDENSKDRLAGLLAGDKDFPSTSDLSTLNTYFDKRIVDDFKNKKIVVVNGWVLSETEARQCALFELLHAN